MSPQTQFTQCLTLSTVTFENFCNAELDSLYWYDSLPGDGIRVCEMPHGLSIEQLRDKLLSAEVMQANDIDLLAAHLLGLSSRLCSPEIWKTLAQRLSRTMAEQLTGCGNRALRMRAQRLNYYIEALIAPPPSRQDQELVAVEQTLQGLKPWDYLEHMGSTWWISSGSPNIYRRNESTQQQWTLGLPTQLDPLSIDRLSAGSIYSKGAYIYCDGNWSHLAHYAPIPLVFEYDSELFFLDHFGHIWHAQPRRPIGRVTCKQAHFARYFNGMVYCLDNSDYGHISTFDMTSGHVERQSVQPVQVCNDLVVTDEYCYLIDKQQGSVFKFDRHFRFLERRLQFGRHDTQLLDPVSIRMTGKHLQVVSWLSQKLTRLRVF